MIEHLVKRVGGGHRYRGFLAREVRPGACTQRMAPGVAGGGRVGRQHAPTHACVPAQVACLRQRRHCQEPFLAAWCSTGAKGGARRSWQGRPGLCRTAKQHALLCSACTAGGSSRRARSGGATTFFTTTAGPSRSSTRCFPLRWRSCWAPCGRRRGGSIALGAGAAPSPAAANKFEGERGARGLPGQGAVGAGAAGLCSGRSCGLLWGQVRRARG